MKTVMKQSNFSRATHEHTVGRDRSREILRQRLWKELSASKFRRWRPNANTFRADDGSPVVFELEVAVDCLRASSSRPESQSKRCAVPSPAAGKRADSSRDVHSPGASKFVERFPPPPPPPPPTSSSSFSSSSSSPGRTLRTRRVARRRCHFHFPSLLFHLSKMQRPRASSGGGGRRGSRARSPSARIASEQVARCCG